MKSGVICIDRQELQAKCVFQIVSYFWTKGAQVSFPVEPHSSVCVHKWALKGTQNWEQHIIHKSADGLKPYKVSEQRGNRQSGKRTRKQIPARKAM